MRDLSLLGIPLVLTGISFLNPDSDSHQDYLVCKAKIEPGFERESRSTAPQQTGSASR
jgi:hypothetical protein